MLLIIFNLTAVLSYDQSKAVQVDITNLNKH